MLYLYFNFPILVSKIGLVFIKKQYETNGEIRNLFNGRAVSLFIALENVDMNILNQKRYIFI